MPTVLHIDGLSNEPMDHFEVKAGETLKDLLDRMGCTWRIEQAPDGPPAAPELSAEAAAFIGTYKRAKAGSALAVFWRHHLLKAEEFDTAEEATRFLEGQEEWDSLAGVAVVDGDTITVWD